MALGKQIKRYREQAGWTLEKLEEISGVAVGTINALERRDSSRSEYGSTLAMAFGLSVEQLMNEKIVFPVAPDAIKARLSDQDDDTVMFSRRPAPLVSDNVRSSASWGRVPLISEVQAGQWTDICDNFNPGEADEWVRPNASKPGRHAFALEVVGESMTSPFVGAGVLTFPEGTTIIVDPNQAADAGHFVVAKDVGTQKATFKKLMYDGGRWYLKPLNPEYKTVEIDDPAVRVIGRVIEYIPRGGKL